MKKFLTMVVALILLFSVCSSCTSKKQEAEYKAKVKKELDSISIEETGYKLVETTEYGNPGVYTKRELIIDGHNYNFSFNDKDNCFFVAVDDKIEDGKEIPLSKYENAFKNYKNFYGCWYFDNQIFLILYGSGSVWNHPQFENCLPHILFLYDYNENTIKYC